MFVRVGSDIRSFVEVYDVMASFNLTLPHSSVYELEEKVLLGEAQYGKGECATSFAYLVPKNNYH
jgi:hypothetical protein